MKSDKNLKFCLDVLKSMRNRNESEPGQTRALENVSKSLKRLRRVARRDQEEIYLVVRQVAEVIIETLSHE